MNSPYTNNLIPRKLEGLHYFSCLVCQLSINNCMTNTIRINNIGVHNIHY